MKKTALFFAIAFFAFSCSKSGDKKAQLTELKKQKSELETKIQVLEKEMGVNKEDNKTKLVATITVQPETFKHFIEVQGNLDSENNINVSPKTGGVITQVPVKVGDIVSAGQILVVIDDNILRQSLAQLQTSYELVKTTYEKQASLWKQNIGSELQYLQAKNNKEGLERQIASLNSQLAQTRVVAPISGTVDAVIARVGEQAAPGQGIVRVVNLSQMKVKAKVADNYINSIKKGDAVNIKLPDINEEIQGKLTFVGQVVNAQSRTFDIEISLSNKDNKLKPNLLTIININDKTKQNALIIDENLIQRTEAGDIVFLAVTENGKLIAKMRKVTKGLNYAGKVEIIDGLAANDQLITVGNQDLVDGQSIKIQEAVANK